MNIVSHQILIMLHKKISQWLTCSSSDQSEALALNCEREFIWMRIINLWKKSHGFYLNQNYYTTRIDILQQRLIHNSLRFGIVTRKINIEKTKMSHDNKVISVSLIEYTRMFFFSCTTKMKWLLFDCVRHSTWWGGYKKVCILFYRCFSLKNRNSQVSQLRRC